MTQRAHGRDTVRLPAALRRPDTTALAVLLTVYAVTAARGVTFWDAGEFLAAVHSLGIPHPPGTPLYVLVARVWADATSWAFGFTFAVNLLSAAATAAAGAIVARLFWRWLGDPLAALAAGLAAGLGSTVWLNATETEVYALTLLHSVILIWVCAEGGARRDPRWLVLAAYLAGLGWALHLTALLSIPAALVLAVPALRNARWLHAIAAVLAGALGATAVLFLLVRARHDPPLDQGDPASWSSLWEVLLRRQYDVAPLWPRRAPLWLQLGNVIEYADWQYALGLHREPPPSWSRTPFTVVYAILAVRGAAAHRRADRASWRAWMVFLATASVGVVVYLNLRAGPSFGAGVLPDGALHEARERDYFFTWAFVAWGAWAGSGCVAAARDIARHAASPRLRALAAWLGLALAALPLALNYGAIREERRGGSRRARDAYRTILASIPPRGVFLAAGDNDTYPLWYAREVLGLRRDVTVVTVPLLPAPWYRRELARRHALLPDSMVSRWYGARATTAALRALAGEHGRPVVTSTMTGAFPDVR